MVLDQHATEALDVSAPGQAQMAGYIHDDAATTRNTKQESHSLYHPMIHTSADPATTGAMLHETKPELLSPSSESSTHTPVVEKANPNHDEPSDFEKKSMGKRILVMFSLCMAVFLAALDVTIITTALPVISADFNSGSGYTWIGAAFLLGNASSVPTWGKVSDIFGRKPVLLVANVVFLIGSLVCALSKGIAMLITGRAVQGVGAGGLVILVNITIADLFSLRSRGAYYGVIGGVWAIASAIGPVIGGVFTQKVSWRWCFYVNLPLDGLAFIIIFFFLDLKTPRTPIMKGLKAIDWIGSVTVIGGVLMFLLGLEYGGTAYPWKSVIVICLIVFGIVTFALFLFYEWKFAKSPIMPTAIFSQQATLACLFVVAAHGMVFISSSYYLPLYFQASRGATPIISGVLLLPTCLALAITSLGTGIYIRKTGRYIDAIYFGFFFMTIGYGLFINLAADSSLAKVIIYQLIAGMGIGPLFQAPLIALQAQIKPRDIATATATFGFVRQLSTSISIVIGGTIYQNQIKTHAQQVIAAVGPQIGNTLTGAGAGASTQIIDTLPQPGKSIIQRVFAESLSKMWILYVILSFLGLLATVLIKTKKLSTSHEETKTGLEAEKEKAAERKLEASERAEEKAAKRRSKGGRASGDLERAVVRNSHDDHDHDLEKVGKGKKVGRTSESGRSSFAGRSSVSGRHSLGRVPSDVDLTEGSPAPPFTMSKR